MIRLLLLYFNYYYHCCFLHALREKCPYLELLWFAFSRIRTEYGEIRSVSLCSVQMRENADQNNSITLNTDTFYAVISTHNYFTLLLFHL